MNNELCTVMDEFVRRIKLDRDLILVIFHHQQNKNQSLEKKTICFFSLLQNNYQLTRNIHMVISIPMNQDD